MRAGHPHVLGLGVGALVDNQVGATCPAPYLGADHREPIDSVPNVSSHLPVVLAQTIAGSQQGSLSGAYALPLPSTYALVVLWVCVASMKRSDIGNLSQERDHS